jgi:hypothetical protein
MADRDHALWIEENPARRRYLSDDQRASIALRVMQRARSCSDGRRCP